MNTSVEESNQSQTRDEKLDMRAMLKQDFGYDLPISGGHGNSRTNAVYIHHHDPLRYERVEVRYLECLGYGRRLEWEMLDQELVLEGGRVLDKIKIETKETTRTKIIRTIESYYFDITECFKPHSMPGSIYGIEFPKVHGGYRCVGFENYEHITPGMGYSFAYIKPYIEATVYIYHGSSQALLSPMSYGDSRFRSHYQQTIRDVFESMKGTSSNIRLARNGAISWHETDKEYLFAQFQFDENDVSKDTYLYLTEHEGRFFKIRLTLPQSEHSTSIANAFAGAWADKLDNSQSPTSDRSMH